MFGLCIPIFMPRQRQCCNPMGNMFNMGGMANMGNYMFASFGGRPWAGVPDYTKFQSPYLSMPANWGYMNNIFNPGYNNIARYSNPFMNNNNSMFNFNNYRNPFNFSNWGRPADPAKAAEYDAKQVNDEKRDFRSALLKLKSGLEVSVKGKDFDAETTDRVKELKKELEAAIVKTANVKDKEELEALKGELEELGIESDAVNALIAKAAEDEKETATGTTTASILKETKRTAKEAKVSSINSKELWEEFDKELNSTFNVTDSKITDVFSRGCADITTFKEFVKAAGGPEGFADKVHSYINCTSASADDCRTVIATVRRMIRAMAANDNVELNNEQNLTDALMGKGNSNHWYASFLDFNNINEDAVKTNLLAQLRQVF